MGDEGSISQRKFVGFQGKEMTLNLAVQSAKVFPLPQSTQLPDFFTLRRAKYRSAQIWIRITFTYDLCVAIA